MKPQIGFFFTELLGPSLIINLAQLVSPSLALPAELVGRFFLKDGKNVSLKMKLLSPFDQRLESFATSELM